MGKEIKWPDVAARLKQASMNPKEVFKQQELLSKKQQANTNSTKDKGKKRGL